MSFKQYYLYFPAFRIVLINIKFNFLIKGDNWSDLSANYLKKY
jgi:hypothetical protein